MLNISMSYSNNNYQYQGATSKSNGMESQKEFLASLIEATENGEDISELLEFVPICNCIDPNKVDDVLTPETRYQLTEEDNLYFQEKYGDVNQLSIYEMDCLLFELQEMGAITQSERLAAHPYYCADGTLGSTTQIHSSNFFGPTKTDDSIYGGDTLSYFKEQLEMLKKELFTRGLTWEEKETIKENAKLLTTVSSVLSGIFSKTTDTHEDTESINVNELREYWTGNPVGWMENVLRLAQTNKIENLNTQWEEE